MIMKNKLKLKNQYIVFHFFYSIFIFFFLTIQSLYTLTNE